MINKDLLPYELSLLLARYGSRRVIAELAKARGLSEPELERQLAEINALPSRHTAARKKVDSAQIIADLCKQYPEKAGHLQTLYSRYLSKGFLPELKDVKRFFERSGEPIKLKSRADIAARLFRKLAELPLTRLTELAAAPDSRGYSSLGAISDEILRRPK